MSLSAASKKLIELALTEDIGSGDVTTEALIPADARATAIFLAKEPLVLCGIDVAAATIAAVDPSLVLEFSKRDGDRIGAGETFGVLKGRCASILKAERTALNFLQRLSGIATKTAAVVDKLHGLSTRVLDTRKTTPGWRELEKYAVKTGGGTNHRFGLFDRVLIKNNHIDALGGDVALALSKSSPARARGLQIEVEVRNEAELRAAVAGAPDVILLDNLGPEKLRSSLAIIASLHPAKKILTEASGGITEANVREIAESGVDFVSMGSLTHSARAVDIALHLTHDR